MAVVGGSATLSGRRRVQGQLEGLVRPARVPGFVLRLWWRLRIGSLFSGIGGLELGLERAGLGVVQWQVEFDPFCRRVLAKHWPNVDRSVVDVKAGNASNLGRVDLICGGFPCQDVSSAGKGAGLTAHTRSGLWFEYARIVAELRPSIVIVENVASGAKRWLPQVRRDLHLLGYDSTAYALSAADVGAPHLRRRIFVVAYALQQQARGGVSEEPVAPIHGTLRSLGDGDGEPVVPVDAEASGLCGVAEGTWSGSSTSVLRGVGDGLSDRVDAGHRLRALGNAVVPQCAEVIGRLIYERIHAATV